MSAVPESMNLPTDPPERESGAQAPGPEGGEKPASAFWQWLAIGVLIACWLAEGALCAAGGS